MIVGGLRGACNVGIAAPQKSWHTNLRAGRENFGMFGQVGLIADSSDERADVEHMLGLPTRSVKFNVGFREERLNYSSHSVRRRN